ncbi:hypothetical protein BHM03_00030791 [Ensete ventricosum]|nr:hypothetical protein BHM03_00030791 [Ensete ventricosum]
MKQTIVNSINVHKCTLDPRTNVYRRFCWWGDKPAKGMQWFSNDSVYEHSRFEPIKDGGRPASSCGKPKQWEKAAPKAGADQVSNSHDRDELRRVCAVEGHPLQPRPPRQSILRGKAESGV